MTVLDTRPMAGGSRWETDPRVSYAVPYNKMSHFLPPFFFMLALVSQLHMGVLPKRMAIQRTSP